MGKEARISGWKAFWDRGGWWRAVLLAVLYMAIYLGAGQVIGAFATRWMQRISSAPRRASSSD